jgi:drug/metabolite transporter (DMT)-like permease
MYLLLGGCVVYLANFLLTKAYEVSEAGFVQPFDDLKLVSNLLVSWFLGVELPRGNLWLGILMIAGASAYLMFSRAKSPAYS